MSNRKLGYLDKQLMAWFLGAGSISFVGAAVAAAISGLHWLKTGKWSGDTAATIWGTPHVDWIGLQEIIDWIWIQPLWFVLLATGSVLIGLSVIADKAAEGW